MVRVAALAVLAAAAACASGASTSDAGSARIDAMPLPDSGPRPIIDASMPGDVDGDVIAGATPVINEFVANHQGTDSCELIEIAGSPSTSYAGFSLLVLDGDLSPNPGLVQQVFDAGTTSADGLWVTAAQPANTLQNGTGTILLVEGYTGGLDDLDDDDDGMLDDEPWTALVDAIAVRDDLGDRVYGGATLLLGDDLGGADPVGGASRIPDGTDTDAPDDWVPNAFDGDGLPGDCDAAAAAAGEALNTPGTPNTVQL